MRRFTILAFIGLIATRLADAQSVISVRSGVVNYSEGAVFIDSKVIDRKPGIFPILKEGSDLLTQDGRAELLLIPNAYLRIGQDSAVRMISAGFGDTQLELLNGSAILDSANGAAGGIVTLIVKGSRVRVEKPARLRVDADPAQLRVYKGAAVVDRAGVETTVGADQRFFLADSSIVQRMTDGSDDLLDLWNQQRNRLIYLNLSSAQTIGDPATDPDDPVYSYMGYIAPAGIVPFSGYTSMAPAYGYGSYGYGYGYAPYPGYPYTGYAFYGGGYPRPGYGPVLRPFMAYPGGYRIIGLRPAAPGLGYSPSQPSRVGSFPMPRPIMGPVHGVPHMPARR